MNLSLMTPGKLSCILLISVLAFNSVTALEAKPTNSDRNKSDRETAGKLIEKARSSPKFKNYLETAIDLLAEDDNDLLWKANLMLCAKTLKSDQFDELEGKKKLKDITLKLWEAESKARYSSASNKDIADIRLTNVEALLKLRKYDVAKSTLDKITNNSDTIFSIDQKMRLKLFYLLSQTHFHLYDFDQAEKFAKDAFALAHKLDLKSTDEELRRLNNSYGLICAARGDNQKALEYFDRALVDGSSAIRKMVLTNKAISLYRTGKLQESKSILGKLVEFAAACEINPNRPSTDDIFDQNQSFNSQIEYPSIKTSRASIAYGIVLSKLKEYNLSKEYLNSVKIKFIENIHAPLVSEELNSLLAPDPKKKSGTGKTSLSKPLYNQKRRVTKDINQFKDFLTLYDSVLELDPILEAEALQSVAENELNRLRYEGWLSSIFKPKVTYRTIFDKKILDNWPVTRASTDYYGNYFLNALLLKQAGDYCSNPVNSSTEFYMEEILDSLYLNCYDSRSFGRYELACKRIDTVEALIDKINHAKLAEIYMLRGWLAYGNLKHKQARDLLYKSLEFQKNSQNQEDEHQEKIAIKTRILLACCEIYFNNFEEAERLIEKALQSAEKASWIRAEDLHLTAHLLAYCYQQNEHFDKLEALCIKYLKHPDAYENHYLSRLTYAYLRLEKFKKCIETAELLKDKIMDSANKRYIFTKASEIKKRKTEPGDKYKKLTGDELDTMIQLYNQCVISFDRLQEAQNCLESLKEYVLLSKKRYGKDAIGIEGIKHVFCLRSDPSFKSKPPKTYLQLSERHPMYKYFRKGSQIKTFLELGKYQDTVCGATLKELTGETLNIWNSALKGDVKFELTEDRKKADLLVNLDSKSASYEGAAYARWRWKHFCYKQPQNRKDPETAQINYFSSIQNGFQSPVINNFNFYNFSRSLSAHESIHFKMIMMHELGHVIGLSHSPYSSHLMFYGTSVYKLPEADVASARLLFAKMKNSK